VKRDQSETKPSSYGTSTRGAASSMVMPKQHEGQPCILIVE
jgi:hypothetical protein